MNSKTWRSARISADAWGYGSEDVQCEHYSRMGVVQQVVSSIFTPSLTGERSFEVEVAECTGSSMVDAEVEGRVLLCGDCAELERPGVSGTSSRISAGESARSKRFIFLSTYLGLVESGLATFDVVLTD